MEQKYCDPAVCDDCVYVGEGGFLCLINNKIVMEDFAPTEDYMSGCKSTSPNCLCEYKIGEDGSRIYVQSWTEPQLTTPSGAIKQVRVSVVATQKPGDTNITCAYLMDTEDGESWGMPYEPKASERQAFQAMFRDAFQEEAADNAP